MLAAERKHSIAEMIRLQKRVAVSELKCAFGVSDETIRRDLAELEGQGILKRTFGGAILNEDERRETPYDVRKREGVAAKLNIAAKVAGLIRDGEFLMIDESSTSFFVSKQLKQLKNLTIITNSMETVAEVADVPGWKVLCTGGEKRASAPSFAGRIAETMVRSYHVQTAIISCGSLDLEAGFSDRHEDTALIKRAMMASAERVILAADSSKLDRLAFAKIGDISEIDTLVTDKKPGGRWLDALGAKLIY